MTKELQHTDALILTHQLAPILETSLFFTSLKESHSQISVREISSNLSLIWGSESHLTGVKRSKVTFYIEIPLDHYDMSINGQHLSDTKTPLLLILTHKHRLTYFSLKKKFKSIRLSINSNYFSSLYQEITGTEFSPHLHSNFLSFNSIQQKNNFLDQILPLTKELSSHTVPHDLDTLSDDLCRLFINSISTEPISPIRPYCNTLAMRAHEIILKSGYEKLSVSDICEKLNASSRSLQQGFKEVYGMGFIEFHKLYRINKLREYLRMNGLKTGELTDLMGVFGFTHAGRFSQEYKTVFGILPSHEEKQIFEKSIFL